MEGDISQPLESGPFCLHLLHSPIEKKMRRGWFKRVFSHLDKNIAISNLRYWGSACEDRASGAVIVHTFHSGGHYDAQERGCNAHSGSCWRHAALTVFGKVSLKSLLTFDPGSELWL